MNETNLSPPFGAVSNNDATLSFAWSLTAPVLNLGFALLHFNIFSDVFHCLVALRLRPAHADRLHCAASADSVRLASPAFPPFAQTLAPREFALTGLLATWWRGT